MTLLETLQYSVLLIDGRSGAGKTTLTAEIRQARHVQTLHLEDLYPGWSGLSAGSLAVAAALSSGSYQRYDWHLDRFTHTDTIDPHLPLVIEGCGALTLANVQAAKRWAARHRLNQGVASIWLDSPEPVRKARAIDRDGDMLATHWVTWARQEDEHYAKHQPWALADTIVTVD